MLMTSGLITEPRSSKATSQMGAISKTWFQAWMDRGPDGREVYLYICMLDWLTTLGSCTRRTRQADYSKPVVWKQ